MLNQRQLSQLSLDLAIDRSNLSEAILPTTPSRLNVPPIKSQGIKTKLVKFILSSISWKGEGRWIEPFVGTGAVAFNLAPPRAVLSDTNVHIIRFYREVADGVVTPEAVRQYLQQEGKILARVGAEHYYAVRERFNADPNSLDFLFLNRACFNGVMRFNKKGGFNVPFGKKPERYRPAYVTKIVNQVAYLKRILVDRSWTFDVVDWRKTLDCARDGDFVYADPPYAGRHTDYYDRWGDDDAVELLDRLRNLPCGFAMSTWRSNKYRVNERVVSLPKDVVLKTFRHFYHVGPTEDLRSEIEEALVIRRGFETSGADGSAEIIYPQ